MGNEQSKEIQTQAKPLSPMTQKIQGFDMTLKKYGSTVASLLGSKYGITADEFMMSIMTAVKKTPKLLECDPKSLFGAILLSAELGLKPNTPEGWAYILPYGKEAQFQVGYKGLIEIAYRSSQVKGIKGVPVYANEFYEECQDGTIHHVAYTGTDLNQMHLTSLRKKFLIGLEMDGADIDTDLKAYAERLKKGKGEVVLAYAICYMDGLEQPIWASVTKDVLNKIQGLSPAGKTNFSPYNSGNDVHNSMQFKAAIKKLFKFLPKQATPDLARAIETDDKMMSGSIAIMTEDGEVEIIETDPKKLNDEITFDDLQTLFDFKKEYLAPEDLISAERIINNKEVASYQKLHSKLKGL